MSAYHFLIDDHLCNCSLFGLHFHNTLYQTGFFFSAAFFIIFFFLTFFTFFLVQHKEIVR